MARKKERDSARATRQALKAANDGANDPSQSSIGSFLQNAVDRANERSASRNMKKAVALEEARVEAAYAKRDLIEGMNQFSADSRSNKVKPTRRKAIKNTKENIEETPQQFDTTQVFESVNTQEYQNSERGSSKRQKQDGADRNSKRKSKSDSAAQKGKTYEEIYQREPEGSAQRRTTSKDNAGNASKLGEKKILISFIVLIICALAVALVILLGNPGMWRTSKQDAEVKIAFELVSNEDSDSGASGTSSSGSSSVGMVQSS